MLRSCHLGELNQELVGKNLTLCGWIQRIREVGGVNFIVMRDRYGTLQLNVDAAVLKDNRPGREDCIQIEGNLSLRPEKDRKDELNGEFELQVNEFVLLNKSETPPFVVSDQEETNEDLRLKYRYLDLRRESMKKNMEFRHQVVDRIRRTLNAKNFLEVETPLLMKSTPEGARDFLVPSRIYPGEFFALPQSPQLYKQMIQVAGLDRYYQLARCLRDEDARNERQLVHTQLDLEMSFVEENDVFGVIENVIGDLFRDLLGVEVDTEFLRLDYEECIQRFGLDKPDLRFGMELFDIGDLLTDSPYEYFGQTVKDGGRIAAMTVPGGAAFSRKQLDSFSSFVQNYRARGIFFCKVGEEGLSGGATKHVPEEHRESLLERSEAKSGDLIVFVSDRAKVTNDAMGYLRNHIARRIDEISPDGGAPFIPKDSYKFLWVTCFPLFEYDEEAQQWMAMHHMFTMPREEDLKYFETGELDKIYGRLYDLVLNGVELGSGSIRIHKKELQETFMTWRNGLTQRV